MAHKRYVEATKGILAPRYGATSVAQALGDKPRPRDGDRDCAVTAREALTFARAKGRERNVPTQIPLTGVPSYPNFEVPTSTRGGTSPYMRFDGIYHQSASALMDYAKNECASRECCCLGIVIRLLTVHINA